MRKSRLLLIELVGKCCFNEGVLIIITKQLLKILEQHISLVAQLVWVSLPTRITTVPRFLLSIRHQTEMSGTNVSADEMQWLHPHLQSTSTRRTIDAELIEGIRQIWGFTLLCQELVSTDSLDDRAVWACRDAGYQEPSMRVYINRHHKLSDQYKYKSSLVRTLFEILSCCIATVSKQTTILGSGRASPCLTMSVRAACIRPCLPLNIADSRIERRPVHLVAMQVDCRRPNRSEEAYTAALPLAV